MGMYRNLPEYSRQSPFCLCSSFPLFLLQAGATPFSGSSSSIPLMILRIRFEIYLFSHTPFCLFLISPLCMPPCPIAPMEFSPLPRFFRRPTLPVQSAKATVRPFDFAKEKRTYVFPPPPHILPPPVFPQTPAPNSIIPPPTLSTKYPAQKSQRKRIFRETDGPTFLLALFPPRSFSHILSRPILFPICVAIWNR